MRISATMPRAGACVGGAPLNMAVRADWIASCQTHLRYVYGWTCKRQHTLIRPEFATVLLRVSHIEQPRWYSADDSCASGSSLTL